MLKYNMVYLKYTVFSKLDVLPSSGVRNKGSAQLGPFEGAGLGHWARLVHLQVMALIHSFSLSHHFDVMSYAVQVYIL
jgi:hypothetical protein